MINVVCIVYRKEPDSNLRGGREMEKIGTLETMLDNSQFSFFSCFVLFFFLNINLNHRRHPG